MARLVVVSVFDSASGLYSAPMVQPSVGAAVRLFQDEVNRVDQNSQLYLHPDDFELHHLSTFDNEDGDFGAVDKKVRVLMRGKDAAIRK